MNCLRNTCLLLTFFFVATLNSMAQIDTEFWFAAPEVSSSSNFDKPAVLRISSFKESSTVTISQPANGGMPPQTITLAANSSLNVDLTAWLDFIECKPGNAIQNKGIKITATAQISVYYEVNNDGKSPELFVLKGKNALGNEFYISSQNFGSNNALYNPVPYSSFNIVATEDNTSVTITPAKNIVGRTAGTPFTITLNKGQTYAAIATSQAATQHLEGSRVSASKPIAITLADDLISAPGNTCADLIGDQTIPISILGTEYIAVKGSLFASLEKLFITATVNGTTLFQDGNLVATLASGQTFQLNFINASTYIRSSQPVYVYHLSGIGCEYGSAILPPLVCTGSLAVTYTKSVDRLLYVNVIVKNGGQGSFKVNNNKTVITADKFAPVPGTSNLWQYATILLPGSYRVDSTISITNSLTFFHLGILLGSEREGTSYGFFSSFNNNYANASTLDPLVCAGGSIQLLADSLLTATYQWTGPNGFTSNQQNPVINNAVAQNAGKYLVTVTLPGCSSQIDSLFIAIGGQVRSTVNQTICDGISFEGYTTAGTYIDTLTTSVGCDSIRTLNLTVKPRSFFTITQTICEGKSFLGYTKTGTYNNTFVAANGCDSIRTLLLTVLPRATSTLRQTICIGQSFLGYTTAGTYRDTLVAANGCDSIRTLVLTVDTQPLPNLGPNREICNGDTALLFPGNYTSYLWQDNSTNNNFIVTQPGLYDVTVTNACGSESDNVLITSVECVILFPNAFTPNGDGKNDYFKILNAFNLKEYSLSIFNRWGQQVFSTTDFTVGWNGEIKGLPQDVGTFVYYCKYMKDNKQFTTKGSFQLIK